ncbi:putative membrane protein [Acinetobacter sp. 1294243]|nr:putative membrane protein [Acinetobacter sp. 1294243]
MSDAQTWPIPQISFVAIFASVIVQNGVWFQIQSTKKA